MPKELSKEQNISTAINTDLPKKRDLKERPKRASFLTKGRTSLPSIPGFRVAIRKLVNMDGSPSDDVDLAIQEGYIPVLARDLDYHKRLINPLAPDEQVKINLGRGEVGLAMKIEQEWFDEIIKEKIQENETRVKAKSKEVDQEDDLSITQGSLTYVRK
jgi:hypothetical protein